MGRFMMFWNQFGPAILLNFGRIPKLQSSFVEWFQALDSFSQRELFIKHQASESVVERPISLSDWRFWVIENGLG
jgi:hypothetical protein